MKNTYSDSIKDLILFGLQSNNTFHDNSDYGVFFIFNKEYQYNDKNTILDICFNFDLKYDTIIDIYLLSIQELSSIRGKQPFFTNALKHGLYV